MSLNLELKNKIESLLFISHKPLELKELSKILKVKQEELQKNLDELIKEYEERAGGISILRLADKYQMAVSEVNSELISDFLKVETTGELSRPSLEALTIIAYRGPVSKVELELIRGVNCSLILKNLLMRGLIESEEDKDKGTAVYSVTMEFLKHLGLTDISQLPDFNELNRNNNLDKLLETMAKSNQ